MWHAFSIKFVWKTVTSDLCVCCVCLWGLTLSSKSERTCSVMMSSNGNIFRVTGPLCGEFTGHRWIPLTRASDAKLWCFLWYALELLNKRLSKQSWGWWFETPSRPLWRHCNAECCRSNMKFLHFYKVILLTVYSKFSLYISLIKFCSYRQNILIFSM